MVRNWHGEIDMAVEDNESEAIGVAILGAGPAGLACGWAMEEAGDSGFVFSKSPVFTGVMLGRLELVISCTILDLTDFTPGMRMLLAGLVNYWAQNLRRFQHLPEFVGRVSLWIFLCVLFRYLKAVACCTRCERHLIL